MYSITPPPLDLLVSPLLSSLMGVKFAMSIALSGMSSLSQVSVRAIQQDSLNSWRNLQLALSSSILLCRLLQLPKVMEGMKGLFFLARILALVPPFFPLFLGLLWLFELVIEDVVGLGMRSGSMFGSGVGMMRPWLRSNRVCLSYLLLSPATFILELNEASSTMVSIQSDIC